MSIVPASGTLLGNWFQIDKTGAVPYNVNQVKTAGFSVGDRIAFCGKWEADTIEGGLYSSMTCTFRDVARAGISYITPYGSSS